MGTAAVTGLGGAKSVKPAKMDEVPRTDENVSGEEIHSVFGFSALTADIEPPTEPDHEIQALTRKREDVPIPEFLFEPTGLHIEPGDTVKLTMATPHHTLMAYHPGFGFVRRVPEDVPPISGPLLLDGAYWLYTFDHEGVYEMNCPPHEYWGMVMRIVVGDIEGPAAEPLPDLCAQPPGGEASSDGDDESEGPELRLPAFSAYTVLTDSALDPERIAEHRSVG